MCPTFAAAMHRVLARCVTFYSKPRSALRRKVPEATTHKTQQKTTIKRLSATDGCTECGRLTSRKYLHWHVAITSPMCPKSAVNYGVHGTIRSFKSNLISRSKQWPHAANFHISNLTCHDGGYANSGRVVPQVVLPAETYSPAGPHYLWSFPRSQLVRCSIGRDAQQSGLLCMGSSLTLDSQARRNRWSESCTQTHNRAHTEPHTKRHCKMHTNQWRTILLHVIRALYRIPFPR